MNGKIKNIFVILTLFFIFLNSFSLSKEKDVKAFSDNVANGFEKLGKIENRKERKKELQNYINKVFDLDWMGNFVLGKNKKNLTEIEKNDFIKTFTEYLVNNYDNLFLMINKENYKFLSMENRGNIYFIHSNIKIESGQQTKVDFRIVEKENGYFITDIITENISFIANQRSDVDSRIGSIGFEEFMKELREKNKKISEEIVKKIKN